MRSIRTKIRIAVLMGVLTICTPVLAFAEPLQSTIKQVKLGERTVELNYERGILDQEIRRLTVSTKDWQEVFEDSQHRGYFDTKRYVNKNLSVRFFNLYHGRFQNIEVTRKGKKGSLTVVQYLDELSLQYKPLWQRYERYSRLTDLLPLPQISDVCHQENVPALDTLKDANFMGYSLLDYAALKEVKKLNLFDASCDLAPFKDHKEEMELGIAKILNSENGLHSKDFLSCLRDGGLADTASDLKANLTSGALMYPIKCKSTDGSAELGAFETKDEIFGQVVLRYAPATKKLVNVYNYASILFHEYVHSTGMTDENRTRDIEACCSEASPEPQRSNSCANMKRDADFYHRFYGYATAFQKLDGFPELWSHMAYGKYGSLPEKFFVDIFDRIKASEGSNGDWADAGNCLKAPPPMGKVACFHLQDVCKSYSSFRTSDLHACVENVNKLTDVLERNMPNNCGAEKRGSLCLSGAMNLATISIKNAEKEGKSSVENFENFASLQEFNEEDLAANFDLALATINIAHPALIEQLSELKKFRSRDRAELQFALANFLRGKEEAPGGEGKFNYCLKNSPNSSSFETVKSCLSGTDNPLNAGNRLGPSTLYHLCKSAKVDMQGKTAEQFEVERDFQCSNLASEQLTATLEEFVVDRDKYTKDRLINSACSISSSASAPVQICHKFLPIIQSIADGMRADCKAKTGPHTSFQCWDTFINSRGNLADIRGYEKANPKPFIFERDSFITAMDQVLNPADPTKSNFAYYTKALDAYNPDVTKEMLGLYYDHFGRPASSELLQSFNINGKTTDLGEVATSGTTEKFLLNHVENCLAQATDSAQCMKNLKDAFLADSKHWFDMYCPRFYPSERGKPIPICEKIEADLTQHFNEVAKEKGDKVFADLLACSSAIHHKLEPDDGTPYDLTGTGCDVKSARPRHSYGVAEAMKAMIGDGPSTALLQFDLNAFNEQAKRLQQIKIDPASVREASNTPQGTQAGGVTNPQGVVTASVPLDPNNQAMNKQIAVSEMTKEDSISFLADSAIASAGRKLSDNLGVPPAEAAEFAGANPSAAAAKARDSSTSSSSATSSSRTDSSPSDPSASDSTASSTGNSGVASSTRAARNPASADSSGASSRFQAPVADAGTSYGFNLPAANNPASSEVSSKPRRQFANAGGASRAPAGGREPSSGGGGGTNFSGGGSSGGANDSTVEAPAGNIMKPGNLSAQQILDLAKSDVKKFEDFLGEKVFVDNLNRQNILVIYKNHSFGSLKAKKVLRYDESKGQFILVDRSGVGG